MVAGVQPYCFAHAAAATLKLLRSAHSNTLPQKNTMTQTAQGMGRAALRVLVLAESELTVISPSRHISCAAYRDRSLPIMLPVGAAVKPRVGSASLVTPPGFGSSARTGPC